MFNFYLFELAEDRVLAVFFNRVQGDEEGTGVVIVLGEGLIVYAYFF